MSANDIIFFGVCFGILYLIMGMLLAICDDFPETKSEVLLGIILVVLWPVRIPIAIVRSISKGIDYWNELPDTKKDIDK